MLSECDFLPHAPFLFEETSSSYHEHAKRYYPLWSICNIFNAWLKSNNIITQTGTVVRTGVKFFLPRGCVSLVKVLLDQPVKSRNSVFATSRDILQDIVKQRILLTPGSFQENINTTWNAQMFLQFYVFWKTCKNTKLKTSASYSLDCIKWHSISQEKAHKSLLSILVWRT